MQSYSSFFNPWRQFHLQAFQCNTWYNVLHDHQQGIWTQVWPKNVLNVANKQKHQVLLTFTVCFQFSIFSVLSSTCCLHVGATSAGSHVLLVSNNLPILVARLQWRRLRFSSGRTAALGQTLCRNLFVTDWKLRDSLPVTQTVGSALAAEQTLSEVRAAFGRVTSAKHRSLYVRHFAVWSGERNTTLSRFKCFPFSSLPVSRCRTAHPLICLSGSCNQQSNSAVNMFKKKKKAPTNPSSKRA